MAYTARESETRTAAKAAIELGHRCGSPRLADWSSISLGFLEVSVGDYTEAIAAFEPLMARFGQVPGPPEGGCGGSNRKSADNS
ncbi:hypothetical protein [Mycolicibacterium gadium]|jgi:hypothetical protein|uniref:hypothetical protein n=1 Tax=Mycolicibacterium gadium TaxID=1794 RepID=UPI0013D1DEA4|nr:hypothetical protein [Mycolicibacterium gadium]